MVGGATSASAKLHECSRTSTAWIRRRLRMYLWKQMEERAQPFCGVEKRRRACTQDFRQRSRPVVPTGFWRLSGHPALVHQALRNAYFDSIGLPRVAASSETLNSVRTAVVRTRMPGGVTGKAREGLPMSTSTRTVKGIWATISGTSFGAEAPCGWTGENGEAAWTWCTTSS